MPFAAYVSDDDPPTYWARGNPFELIQQGTSPLGILTHPKLWRSHLVLQRPRTDGSHPRGPAVQVRKGWK